MATFIIVSITICFLYKKYKNKQLPYCTVLAKELGFCQVCAQLRIFSINFELLRLSSLGRLGRMLQPPKCVRRCPPRSRIQSTAVLPVNFPPEWPWPLLRCKRK